MSTKLSKLEKDILILETRVYLLCDFKANKPERCFASNMVTFSSKLKINEQWKVSIVVKRLKYSKGQEERGTGQVCR